MNLAQISGSFYGAQEKSNSLPGLPDHLGQADFLRLMTEQLKHQDPAFIFTYIYQV